MTISMSSASLPVFVKMLKNARTWLDKAAAYAEQKKFDPSVLVQSRLAPDMFPLAKQIQLASDHAKGCTARLAGLEVPRFEDKESTIPELQARIDKTIAFIESVPAAKVDGSEDRDIVLPSPHGERRFKGEDYLKHYALPNFYFHVTTTYAILRHNGVDLGKRDYIAGAG
ncbi:MAG: DUF1993 domain-containing protein [Myxococcota bacterium]